MTTESKLHTAKAQMIYWSRRVSELTKQMERERAIASDIRRKPDGRGLGSQPAGSGNGNDVG